MTGDKLKGGGSGPKTIPMSSPLYLHPSDSPSLNVTQIIFDGTNYDMWADAVKNGLDAKNKLGFIKGTVQKPSSSEEDDDLEFVAWRQCNAMLRAWLRNVIDPKLHPSITFTQSIAEIWEELRGRYSAGNAPRVHQLKGELNECKQGKETVVEYYTRLKIIWDELAKYSKIKNCNCGAAASIAKEKEEEKVHQFLMGLDAKVYGQIRSNLLMEDPIASLNRVYAIVLREERHSSLTQVKEERMDAAMATKINGGRDKGKYPRDDEEDTERPPPPRCSYCGKYYHTEENCYDKHGYEEVKARERGRGRRSRGGGNRGRGRGRGQHQANAMTGTNRLEEQGTSNIPFTAEEIDRLKILVKNSPDGTEKLQGMKITVNCEWLIDSGASHHMTGKREYLRNIWEEEHSTVSLPDGRQVEATDRTTKTMIGRGEHRGGVYYYQLNKDEIAGRMMSASDNKLWHRRKRPKLDNLRVLGCLCYVHNKDRTRDKFSERGTRCMFIGYPHSKKGWKVYDLREKRVFVSRDVIFYENIYPYHVSNSDSPSQNKIDPHIQNNPPYVDYNDDASLDHVVRGSVESGENDGGTHEHGGSETEPETEDRGGVVTETNAEQQMMGRGAREKFDPAWKKDYYCKSTRVITPNQPAHCEQSPSVRSGTRYPINNYVVNDCFSTTHKAFLAAIDKETEPITYQAAVKEGKWREAMSKEIEALEKNKTWRIVTLPRGKKAIGCKWVYKIKYKADGTVERYKARLVAQGFTQTEGVDFHETYAPVAKMTSVRCMLAVAVAKGWHIEQLDVNNAFLHGDLEEEVYMRIRQGFEKGAEMKVCKLLKSIYGLKQASRNWFAKLTVSLKNYGFIQSMADYSLFTLNRGDIFIGVLVYVDDMIVVSNNKDTCDKFKNFLNERFGIKDLGKLKYFLGIEVAHCKEGLFLNQRKYALSIIEETGMKGAKTVYTPIRQMTQFVHGKGIRFERHYEISSSSRSVGVFDYH
ncbi:uncharacterized protein LOC141631842 [Silene latifolia]|uniref:uncharacterized protein LOC141631842 n=1 Tax=Silene latifolia TaxID=37657 RepID=UPI003D77899E